jgi:hypothetical protein
MDTTLKILTLVATAAISAVLAILGYLGSRELWDVNLVEKFKSTHFETEEARRRLSPYLIRMMKSPDLRQQLRQFIFWDVMKRNFALSISTAPFVRDRHDWHLLGDAMLDMKNERDRGHEKRDFQHWWCDQKDVVSKRWLAEPARKKAIDGLYAYLDELYFGADWRDGRGGCAPGSKK